MADGNPAGLPVTVQLTLTGLPASQRDGRLRAAITTLIGRARKHGCHAIAVETWTSPMPAAKDASVAAPARRAARRDAASAGWCPACRPESSATGSPR